jgi:hypothetical protein
LGLSNTFRSLALENMLSLLQVRQQSYKHALARFAFSLESGTCKLCFGRFDFLGSREDATNDARYEYGKLVLIRRTLSLEEASTLASELVQEKRLRLSDIAIQLTGNFNQITFGPYVASRQSYGQIRPEWPSALFQFQLDGVSLGNIPQGPQVKLDLPFFPSGNEAIVEFCELATTGYPLAQILFVLPDFRARIRTMKILEGRLSISVEAREESLKNLKAKFYVESDGKPTRSSDLPLEDDHAEFEFNGELSLAMVHLFSAITGEDLDNRAFSPYRQADEGITIEASEQRVRELIRRGEGLRVEFKEDIKSDHRFLDSVIAFANTYGGTILVGVNDDCEIEGVQGSDDLKKTIQNLISDLCDPPPEISLNQVGIEGRTVIIVDVPQGTKKPYQVRNRGFFVRRGSSNRRATTIELGEMFKQYPR